MTEVGKSQYRAQCTFYAGEVIGGEIAGLISYAALRQFFLADDVCQVTRIYSHRTGHGTETVAGTGLVAGIAVLFFEQCKACRVLAALFQPGYFALQHDTLARGKGKAAGETVDFAETALDAFVSYE